MKNGLWVLIVIVVFVVGMLVGFKTANHRITAEGDDDDDDDDDARIGRSLRYSIASSYKRN